jgi:hypothetical protein
VREECPPNLFLILGGQALDFGYGLFKCFDHDASISNCLAQSSKQSRGSRFARRQV